MYIHRAAFAKNGNVVFLSLTLFTVCKDWVTNIVPFKHGQITTNLADYNVTNRSIELT